MCLSFFFFLPVNVMRCTICHQDYKQTDIIDNYFVKDTTEATSTADEKAAQVPQSVWLAYKNINFRLRLIPFFQVSA